MKRNSALLFLSVAVSCCMMTILSAPAAHADGEGCPTRPATAQEKAFYRAVSEKIGRAMAVPRDWDRSDHNRKDVEEREICPNDARPMSFVLEYEYRFKEEVEREAGMQAALAALEGTPEQQARKAALEREQDELFKARKEARRRGNASEVERITAKMKDVSRKQDALDQEIMTAYSSKAFSGEMQREMGRGLPASNRVSVRVRVNPYHRVNAYAGDEAAPVGGGAQAFWTRYGVDHVEALLGGWKSTADNKFRRFEPVFELSVSQTQVQAVSIQIQPRKSDRETAEGLLRQFDLRALQALLN